MKPLDKDKLKELHEEATANHKDYIKYVYSYMYNIPYDKVTNNKRHQMKLLIHAFNYSRGIL